MPQMPTADEEMKRMLEESLATHTGALCGAAGALNVAGERARDALLELIEAHLDQVAEREEEPPCL